ncbi:MAG: CU044_2847 family protein [Synechococcaceae cyanobacterium]|jgi:hypothetical protein
MQTQPPVEVDTVLMDLGEGLSLRVQVPPVKQTRGEVSRRSVEETSGPLSPDHAFDAIRALSQRLGDLLKEVQPTKASVTYGLELEVRDGALLATLVRGGGKTSLEVTLEWEQSNDG